MAAPTICIICGGKIAPILAGLGSLTCHDCRAGGESGTRVVRRPAR